MTLPSWFDMQIHAGDALVTFALAVLSYGLRRAYTMVNRFLDRVDRHEADLDEGLQMVDTHSLVLLKSGMLTPPVKKVHRRRKSDRLLAMDEEEMLG